MVGRDSLLKWVLMQVVGMMGGGIHTAMKALLYKVCWGQQAHRQATAAGADALALDLKVQWQVHLGGLVCGLEIQQTELSLQRTMPMTGAPDETRNDCGKRAMPYLAPHHWKMRD